MRCKQEVKPEKKPEAKSGKTPSKKAKGEEISEPKPQTRRKRLRTSKKATETEQATRGLVRELDESDNTPRHHFTLETPVSEHGAGVMLRTPSQTPLLIHIRPIAVEDSTAMTTPVSDSGVDFTPEMESVVDQYVREGQNSDDEKLAEEAAKEFENLDNADGKLVSTAFSYKLFILLMHLLIFQIF